MKYLKLFEELNHELWYHGTDADFTEFREPDDTTKPNRYIL